MVTKAEADKKIEEFRELRKKLVNEVNRMSAEIMRVDGAIIGIEMLFKEPEPPKPVEVTKP